MTQPSEGEAQRAADAARRAGTFAIGATTLGLLAGVAAAAITALAMDSDRGKTPCDVNGILTYNPSKCVTSYSEIATESAIVGVAVLLTVVLLALLAAVGWRLLKWALSG